MSKSSNFFSNERGVAHLLILVAVLGLLVFLVVSNLATFKSGIFKDIYNKVHSSFASGPTVQLTDTFDRPNTQTDLGTSSSGFIWTYDRASFVVQNNQASVVTGCPAPGYALADGGSSDGEVDVTLAVNTQDARIPFRYKDSNNLYWLESTGGDYTLSRSLNGQRTDLASSSSTKPANGDQVKITYQGSLISVLVNNQSVISVTDNSVTGTKAGIGTWCGTDMRFDNFVLKTTILATPTPNPTTSPLPSVTASPSPATDPALEHRYNLGILVIKYFPLTADGKNIDINVTGDVGDPLDVIRQRTVDITNTVIKARQDASKYLGYKNPTASAAVSLNVVATKEYLQAVPFAPRQESPRYPAYNQILTDNNICDYVDNKGVREVWFWAYQGPNKDDGQPYLGIAESKMSSKYGDVSNSYRYNDLPICQHTYVVITGNYGRGSAEFFHSWGHQLEAELSAVGSNIFSQFQGPNYPQTLGVTGRCGSVHNPANARYEYDYNNPTPQKSDCLDWTPDGLGQTTDISCQNWGCSDISDSNNSQLNYLVWLWQNLPGIDNNKTYQGAKLRNFWDINADWDTAMANHLSLTLPPSSGSNPQITPSSPSPTLSQIPIGYWKFDENLWTGQGAEVIDTSAGADSGVVTKVGTGPFPKIVAGKFNNAGSFVGLSYGNDGYLTFGNIFDMNDSQSFSISLWAKYGTQTSANNYPAVIGKLSASGQGYAILIDSSTGSSSNQIGLHLTDSVGHQVVTGDSKRHDDNSWHHYVVVVDRGAKQAYLYVDGVLKGKASTTVLGTLSNTSSFVIGARQDSLGLNNGFSGSIDEVSFYRGALSSTDVQNLFKHLGLSTSF